ncbi:hypothetical protein [Halanaerobacter jeridensis]|uniref:Uncharacterized protein n=1 Tax=Halanaerobacter jeridensis TaxID=706427 RepID=A0A938XUQ6_9FIRM|nr:hypothetical protein [Halanaerobacter jeridensis]MBM7558151.1 hypothetical protein [Halanaerobacter jeridensis]
MRYLYYIISLLLTAVISFFIGKYICENDVNNKFSKIVNKIFSQEVLLSLMAIIVSSVGVYISDRQAEIAKQQAETAKQQTVIYRQKVYPHFNIHTYLGDKRINDRYINQHINIYNNGGNFYELKCSSIVFLKVKYDTDKYYIPANSFFGVSKQIVSDNNLIYKFIGFKNNLKRSSLSRTLAKHAKKNEKILGKAEEIIFVKVYYQDIFGKNHTLYFNGSTGELLDNNVGEKLFKKHKKRLKKMSYKLFSEFSVNTILNYIKKHKPDDKLLTNINNK